MRVCENRINYSRDNKNTGLGEKVWKESYLSFRTDEVRFLNYNVFFVAVFYEVEETQEVKVWSVMPFIGEGASHRGTAAEEYLVSSFDMCKIGNPDDDLSSDP